MAITQNPSVRTIILGDNITSLDQSTSFVLSEKLEASRLIKSTDGEVVLDYSFINTVQTIYFYSAGTYKVTLTVGPTILPIEVTGAFRLDPTAAFRTSLTSVSISTSSATDILVDIRIYGIDA
jgi:hypothetical protein